MSIPAACPKCGQMLPIIWTDLHGHQRGQREDKLFCLRCGYVHREPEVAPLTDAERILEFVNSQPGASDREPPAPKER